MVLKRRHIQASLAATVAVAGLVGLTGCQKSPLDGFGGPERTDAADTSTAGDAHARIDAKGGDDADPTGDADGADGDIRRRPDTDTAVCPPRVPNDCDFDGLHDCKERLLGTDVCTADTDGDGLNDADELDRGTDPVAADTDGDGVDDGREVEVHLDPTASVTYDDGIPDGQRGVLKACADPDVERLDFYRSPEVSVGPNATANLGNWRLALPPTFDNYTDLTIQGADLSNRQAAAVYADPGLGIAGLIVSEKPRRASDDAPSVIDRYRQRIDQLGEVDSDFGAPVRTFDNQSAARVTFVVKTDAPQTASQMRQAALFALTSIRADQVSGLPAPSGATYDRFHLSIAAIFRTYQSGDPQLITTLAVVPSVSFEARDKVEFRVNDLTNGTNVAAADDDATRRCQVAWPDHDPPTNFYWVLDHSASMYQETQQVYDAADQFYADLENTALDYQLGVTTMKQSQFGRLRRGASWHRDLPTFMGEINWLIGMINNGGGFRERGLAMARRGIEYMKGINGTPPDEDRIDLDANLITIIISDADAETFQGRNLDSPTAALELEEYKEFFKKHTTMFAIVGQSDQSGSCQANPGFSYREIARATGGSTAGVCSSDLGYLITQITWAANANLGYELPSNPIASSLRVRLNGQWVPRSHTNGFDYSARTNSISFFGAYRPDQPAPGQAPDTISAAYQTWRDLTKE